MNASLPHRFAGKVTLALYYSTRRRISWTLLLDRTRGFQHSLVINGRGLATSIEPDRMNEEIVLFQRGSAQYTLMRTGLGFSCFHTAYWIWYTTYFIPTMNNAALTTLHIDPSIGVAGLTFAAIMQSAFFMLPRRLISQLTWKPHENIFCLYTHTIPLIQPSERPIATIPVVDVDENNNRKTLIQASSPEAVQILNELGGELQRFDGQLLLRPQGTWLLPFMLDFRSTSVIPDSDLLLEALLYPEYMGKSHLPWNKQTKVDRKTPVHRTRRSTVRQKPAATGRRIR